MKLPLKLEVDILRFVPEKETKRHARRQPGLEDFEITLSGLSELRLQDTFFWNLPYSAPGTGKGREKEPEIPSTILLQSYLEVQGRDRTEKGGKCKLFQGLLLQTTEETTLWALVNQSLGSSLNH